MDGVTFRFNDDAVIHICKICKQGSFEMFLLAVFRLTRAACHSSLGPSPTLPPLQRAVQAFPDVPRSQARVGDRRPPRSADASRLYHPSPLCIVEPADSQHLSSRLTLAEAHLSPPAVSPTSRAPPRQPCATTICCRTAFRRQATSSTLCPLLLLPPPSPLLPPPLQQPVSPRTSAKPSHLLRTIALSTPCPILPSLHP